MASPNTAGNAGAAVSFAHTVTFPSTTASIVIAFSGGNGYFLFLTGVVGFLVCNTGVSVGVCHGVLLYGEF